MTRKISTIVDEQVWREFKTLSEETHQSLSGLLTEALKEFIQKKRIRPNFIKHMDDSIEEHEQLGQLLAK